MFAGLGQGFTGGAGVDPGLSQLGPDGTRIAHPTPGQIVIGLAMGAMVAGYLIIRSMIMEAV